MIPIRDENPTRSVPFVNFTLIGVNVAVWLIEVLLISSGASWLIPGYGVVPSRISDDPAGEAFTVLSSMFMHGGWDTWAATCLLIFGDNVGCAPDARYICFIWLAASRHLAQILIDPEARSRWWAHPARSWACRTPTSCSRGAHPGREPDLSALVRVWPVPRVSRVAGVGESGSCGTCSAASHARRWRRGVGGVAFFAPTSADYVLRLSRSARRWSDA
jgi:hypothetical protein